MNEQDESLISLLKECAELFSYVTFHDGRYGQEQSYSRFQMPAQKLLLRIEKRLASIQKENSK